MNIKYTVVVLINDEVWGTWTLPQKLMPDQELQVRNFFRRSVLKKYPIVSEDDKFEVDFCENIEVDNFEELLGGIEESLENEFG